MWNIISILILIIETVLLFSFIVGRFKKRRLNETAIFIGSVIIVNYSLHLVPFLYTVFELGDGSNVILGMLDCVGATIKLFVGEARVSAVAKFTNDFPHFSIAYMLGVVIALLTTISAVIEAFRNSVTNGVRVAKALKKDNCDIIIGNSANALHYATTCNSVLLLDDSVDKSTGKELIENGNAILRKSFTVQLLRSHHFNKKTKYNIVCIESNNVLDYIDTFIAYKKANTSTKNIYLYVELEGEMAETIRREIIEKNMVEAFIKTFSVNELIARTFIEANPVAKYLPDEYIENAAIKSNTKINIFMLGFGALGKELYRQLVLNNQLVTYDGEYKVLPINYYLCDTDIDSSEWNINGLSEAINELNIIEYFPLPKLPFKTNIISKAPTTREVLGEIKRQAQKDDSYTFIIVDTEEDCRNIEIGSKLKTLLFGSDNYHAFVRSEVSYTEDDEFVTYFGDSKDVFNSDVIVNDSLSVMAKKLNEVYTAQYADEEERNRPDFAQYIHNKAEKEWNGLDYFTQYSNIYSAMNLRTVLNLLGLDYVKDGNGANTLLISERYGRKGEYEYYEYFTPTVRNALLAQEHARWNAYHLLSEYMPLEKSGITVKNSDGKKVRFNVKNTVAKKHACITTFSGLDSLSSYLAERAGNGCTAADYDYYIYDEMLISSAEELLSSLGYSVIEKSNK